VVNLIATMKKQAGVKSGAADVTETPSRTVIGL